MKSNSNFRGAGVALVTPFKTDGSIDEAALERLVDFQIEEGTNFLVPCGTTGENPALTQDEHRRVVEIVVRRAGEMFGLQAEAIEKKRSGFPMVMYNVPGRTGVNMAAATTLQIAREIPNVIGVKEASGNLEQIMTILRERQEGFLVISGDDAWTLPLVAAGGDGIISVAANEIPRLMSEMTSAALKGDFDAARAVHNRILPLMTGNFIESNPIPVKAAMKMLGIIPNDTVRSPLAPITEANRKKLESILRECGLKLEAVA